MSAPASASTLRGRLSRTSAKHVQVEVRGALGLNFDRSICSGSILAFQKRHLFWRSIWHLLWHPFWDSFWHSIWHSIQHSARPSLWHGFGSRWLPQHPRLAMWGSGPGGPHSILGWQLGVRVQAPSTASWAGYVGFGSRRPPLHPGFGLAEGEGGGGAKGRRWRKEGGREGGRKEGRKDGVAPLLKSRDPHLAGREKWDVYPRGMISLT